MLTATDNHTIFTVLFGASLNGPHLNGTTVYYMFGTSVIRVMASHREYTGILATPNNNITETILCCSWC